MNSQWVLWNQQTRQPSESLQVFCKNLGPRTLRQELCGGWSCPIFPIPEVECNLKLVQYLSAMFKIHMTFHQTDWLVVSRDPYNGWLVGILIMAYYILIYLGFCEKSRRSVPSHFVPVCVDDLARRRRIFLARRRHHGNNLSQRCSKN